MHVSSEWCRVNDHDIDVDKSVPETVIQFMDNNFTKVEWKIKQPHYNIPQPTTSFAKVQKLLYLKEWTALPSLSRIRLEHLNIN